MDSTGGEIARVWAELEARLPIGPGGLNPPATEEQVLAAERAVGYRFPEEMRASYLLHDGGYVPSSDEHPQWGPPIEFGSFLELLRAWGS